MRPDVKAPDAHRRTVERARCMADTDRAVDGTDGVWPTRRMK